MLRNTEGIMEILSLTLTEKNFHWKAKCFYASTLSKMTRRSLENWLLIKCQIFSDLMRARFWLIRSSSMRRHLKVQWGTIVTFWTGFSSSVGWWRSQIVLISVPFSSDTKVQLLPQYAFSELVTSEGRAFVGLLYWFAWPQKYAINSFPLNFKKRNQIPNIVHPV